MALFSKLASRMLLLHAAELFLSQTLFQACRATTASTSDPLSPMCGVFFIQKRSDSRAIKSNWSFPKCHCLMMTTTQWFEEAKFQTAKLHKIGIRSQDTVMTPEEPSSKGICKALDAGSCLQLLCLQSWIHPASLTSDMSVCSTLSTERNREGRDRWWWRWCHMEMMGSPNQRGCRQKETMWRWCCLAGRVGFSNSNKFWAFGDTLWHKHFYQEKTACLGTSSAVQYSVFAPGPESLHCHPWASVGKLLNLPDLDFSISWE